MPRITASPAQPRGAAALPFTQRIELRDGKALLGHVVWHLAGNDDGVVQVIDLHVTPRARRAGHGSRLLAETVLRAARLCAARRTRLRRLWLAVEQKSHVIARAFLTRHGFHHTATIENVLRRQDLLVYLKAFD